MGYGQANLRNRRSLGLRGWKPEIIPVIDAVVGEDSMIVTFQDSGQFGDLTIDDIVFTIDDVPAVPTSFDYQANNNVLVVEYTVSIGEIAACSLAPYNTSVRNSTGAYLAPFLYKYEGV